MTGSDDDRKSSECGVADIRALLFDLDGVLWDSNALHAEAMAQVCAEVGLDMPDYARVAGMSTPEAFALAIAENRGPSDFSVADLTTRKQSIFRELVGQVPSDHEALRAAFGGWRPASLALVTGASRTTADAYLRRLPAGFFDLVITADDGLPSKPAPDAYIAAAKRLGVSSSQCVVFEDSAAGLKSARAAGMRTAHITYAWGGTCDGASCGADWCAPTVAEAIEMIRSERC